MNETPREEAIVMPQMLLSWRLSYTNKSRDKTRQNSGAAFGEAINSYAAKLAQIRTLPTASNQGDTNLIGREK